MKIEKLKPGMTVYSVETRKMGNTSLRTAGIFEVRIVEVDYRQGLVFASWNTNPTRKYCSNDWARWKLTKPELVRNELGQYFQKKKVI